MEKIFDKLGGLYDLEDSTSVFNERGIKDLEKKINSSLPEDYKEYLLKFGIKGFNEMVFFKPINNESEYVHLESTEIPNYKFKGGYIEVLFGNYKDSEDDLHYNLRTYGERIPSNFIPIGYDGAGNLIVMGLDLKNYSNIFYWNHENEWDEEDYFEETGVKMPEEAKFQNLYLIASNFTSFLEKLEVIEED